MVSSGGDITIPGPSRANIFLVRPHSHFAVRRAPARAADSFFAFESRPLPAILGTSCPALFRKLPGRVPNPVTPTHVPVSEELRKALDGLNAAQREAAETVYGPVVVIAGPGTGKTQIVACRAANILAKTDARPENLLITTFTDAGVVSIKKRLVRFLGSDAYRIKVSTIHAFSNDVIRMYPEKFLRFRAMTMLDDIEQISIFEKIIESSKFEFLYSDYDKFHYLRDIRDRIGKLKQEAVSPEALESATDDLGRRYAEELSTIKPTLKKHETTAASQKRHVGKLRELADAYRKYLAECYERGLYDYADMIGYVGEVLATDGDLRATLAERYQFVMLDEFQDMNGAQNRIIDAILSETDSPNVMCVGDDDQSIYRFQGASLENLFAFSTRYPNPKFVVLTENYRSIDAVLRLAEKSVSHNGERIGNHVEGIVKHLNSNRSDEGAEVSIRAFANPLEEKAVVLRDVRRYLAEGVPPEEIAILTRTNAETEEWAAFLSGNGIGVESKASANALSSEYVSLATDVLEVVSDPGASEDRVIRLARSGMFDLEPSDVLVLNRALYKLNYTRKDRLKFLDAAANAELLADMGLKHPEKFVAFHAAIAECAPRNVRLYEDMKRIFESLAFVAYVESHGTFADLEDVFTLFDTAKAWDARDERLTVSGFLKRIGYYRTYGLPLVSKRVSEIPNRVKVLTAHQSKGLEYEAVFLPNLAEKVWGNRNKADQLKLPDGLGLKFTAAPSSDAAEQDERRLFFVGITRAKSKLSLSYAESDGEKPGNRVASMFLTELGVEPSRNGDPVNYSEVIASELRPNVMARSEMTAGEEAYVREFLANYRLSPSDLNKFLEDPKTFLRDSIFKYPFEDNEFTVFGKTYHRALELFYLSWKKEGRQPGLDRLAADFDRALRQEVLTPEIREKLLKKGHEGLEGWYAEHVGKLEIPLELEYNFYPRGIVFDGVPLTGKIDKIELRYPDSDEVRLVDYKTGRPKSLNEVKGETKNGDGKYFRQLLFYKLLFELDSGLFPKYRPTALALEFVEGKDGKYVSLDVDFTEGDMERLKGEIRDSWKKISDPEYWKEVLRS